MDPVADMLVVIKNGYLAKKSTVTVPYSKFKLTIAKVLEQEKFVGKVQKIADSQGLAQIKIDLLWENLVGGREKQKPKLTEIRRISKLGRRVYIAAKDIPKVKGGRGVVILSTPQGVMTGRVAKAKSLGGEVICEVW